MNGESGTEREITEIQDLQERIQELEMDFDTCRDDLEVMTGHRDNLADAFQDAINELEDIYTSINTTNHRAVLSKNS